jgi:hypothetical protein
MDLVQKDQWKAAFPYLYRTGASFECLDGWSDLLWQLSTKLEELISQLPESERAAYFAVQVKEKWGKLRFYLSTSTEDMDTVIYEAEEQSGHLCERCGAPGALLAHGGWVMTRCAEHVPPQDEHFRWLG